MANLLYEKSGFLKEIRIETEEDRLLCTRKNIFGKKLDEMKIADIKNICTYKKRFSSSLSIERDSKAPLVFGGLNEEETDELKHRLNSLVDIRAARDHQTIVLEDARKGTLKILEKLREDFDARPIISYLINQGVQLDTSDIHATPRKDDAILQYRLDGLLQEVGHMKKENFERILTTLKNRAKLTSYKKNIPQDGSFHFDEGGLNLDVRCATIPTLFGEKVVMRILNTAKRPLSLDDLGFSEKMLADYKKLITSPQGSIILTGPAGSGKTTTIFASLIHIYHACEGKVNIATLEDPVEYIVKEFQQTQINPAVGLTFAAGLKSLLRLDPDILTVGEIRDPETAQMAMRTALTGHLIFTTLHSRDTIGVFPRLIEMDMKPGMVSSAVTAVLYQRLIRKLCIHCRVETEPEEELLRIMKKFDTKSEKYYTAKGCQSCSNTRYMGRTGIVELLIVDEKIREMVAKGSYHGELYDYCQERGMKFLWENALEKISSGITDFKEIMRVCPRIII